MHETGLDDIEVPSRPTFLIYTLNPKFINFCPLLFIIQPLLTRTDSDSQPQWLTLTFHASLCLSFPSWHQILWHMFSGFSLFSSPCWVIQISLLIVGKIEGISACIVSLCLWKRWRSSAVEKRLPDLFKPWLEFSRVITKTEAILQVRSVFPWTVQRLSINLVLDLITPPTLINVCLLLPGTGGYLNFNYLISDAWTDFSLFPLKPLLGLLVFT